MQVPPGTSVVGGFWHGDADSAHQAQPLA